MILVTSKCPYCNRGRSPLEIRNLPGGARICHSCAEKHEAAVLAMSGLKAKGDGTFETFAPPPLECSECHVTPEQLRASGRDAAKWSIIYENGVYRYFCTPCGEAYETKRREFFKDTAYAKQRGL